MKKETTKLGMKFIPESDNDCFLMGRLYPLLRECNLSCAGSKIEHLFIPNTELERLLFIEIPTKAINESEAKQ